MPLRSPSSNGRLTNNMPEILPKGKACLSCRARKSVSSSVFVWLVSLSAFRLEMRWCQTIMWQMLRNSASVRV